MLFAESFEQHNKLLFKLSKQITGTAPTANDQRISRPTQARNVPVIFNHLLLPIPRTSHPASRNLPHGQNRRLRKRW
jgi:hypothetical protein